MVFYVNVTVTSQQLILDKNLQFKLEIIELFMSLYFRKI